MIFIRQPESNPGFKPVRVISCRGGRRGFTLVEMLTVVAVLVVLVGLLMPTLFRAIRFARLASCASSMHGVYTALVIYAGDNKNFVPNVAHYNPGRGYGGGSSIGRMSNKSFFFGALADTKSFDNLKLVTCPGTIGWGGSNAAASSNLYKNIGTAASPDYALREVGELASVSDAWCNYALRWGGWWHKVYASPRLMMAEAVGYYTGPRYWEIELHGGTFGGVAHNIGGQIAHVGEASMNVVGSDGRVVRLLDYANLQTWNWNQMLGGFTVPANTQVAGASASQDMKTDPNFKAYTPADVALPYYYPANDRSGDAQVTGQPNHADPTYEDYTIYPEAMSDGTWAFWPTFDTFLFNNRDVQPWSGGYWPPAEWQNP